MKTETLSVRLAAQAKTILAESAPTHDAAGASALARDILEKWAYNTRTKQIRASALRAGARLRETGGEMVDDPAEFFPACHDAEHLFDLPQ